MIIMVYSIVRGQEAYPVASKSEYIREGYAFTLKGVKYKKQKKKNECFAKFIKRIRRSLQKCTTSVVCFEFDLQRNQTR